MTNTIERIHNEILNVSYSKLFDIDIPWNSAEVFECACKLDFDGIKGDVTPTKDGKLIMCHDAEFWFDENGRVYKDRGQGQGTVLCLFDNSLACPRQPTDLPY